MPRAPLPPCEESRLRTLNECQVLDTEPEDVFDDITSLAAQLCESSMAFVSLVDTARLWFKSAFGSGVRDVDREVGFCSHTILRKEPFIVTDALTDPRTCDNVMVLGPPYLRFYAGIPLIMSDGHAMGTLCVLDTTPRDFTSRQLSNLKTLAGQVITQLELRRANWQIARSHSDALAMASRLERITSQIPGFVYQFELRPDGTYCLPYASDKIQQIYQLSPEDVRSDASAIFAAIHPDDIGRVMESMRTSTATLSHWQQEFRVLAADGKVRWLSSRANPSLRSDGTVLWNGFTSDVTEQRLEQERSMQIRTQMNAVVQASTHVSIIATDLQGIITVWNAGAERMTGYSAGEMIGVQTSRILHLESEIELNRQRLQKLYGTEIDAAKVLVDEVQRGGFSENDWTWIRKDGSHFSVHLVLMSIRDDAGEITGFVGVATDVTEVHRVQSHLRQERERLEMALSGGELGTWDWNLQTNKETWDQQFCQLLGEDYPPAHMGVDSFFARIHPDDIGSARRNLTRHVSDPSESSFYEAEFRVRQKTGGWRWVQARGRLMQYDENSIPLRMLGTLADISVRKKYEEEMVKARLQADAANKAKSQFLANMSHEIRTPLTSILGYSELLSTPGLSEQDIAHDVEIIKRAGNHLLSIINDVLDLSKIEAGRMRLENVSMSPVDVVRDVVSVLAPGAKAKGLSFIAKTFGLIPEHIISDAVIVRQILMNLLGNAIKFTEFGDVWLTVRFLPAGAEAFDRMVFEVSDTGIGMTQEQCNNLFTPFMQADTSMTRRFGGTGLGLTISRRKAELLGGRIDVESQLGVGSTFRLTIATGAIRDVRMLSSVSLMEVPRPRASATQGRKIEGRILLAEDNPVNQFLFATILKTAGAQVDTVENGLDALIKVETEQNSSATDSRGYDLILMDMQMPVLDGYAATSRLRESGFTKPILALTAHALMEDRKRCCAAGCDDFVSKPVEKDMLIQIVGEWLNKGQGLTSAAVEVSEQAPSNAQKIDLTALVSSVNGDLAVLRNLTTLLQSNSSHLIAEMHRAMDSGNLLQTQQLAHSLKGTVSSFMVDRPFATATAIEALARAGNITEARIQLESLSLEVSALLEELKLLQGRELTNSPR